jgi:hypothetical protein
MEQSKMPTSRQTPPGFGVSHPQRIHAVTVGLIDGNEITMMVPKGMAVAEHLHEYYWRMRSYIAEMFAEADRLGVELSEYGLSKPDGSGALKLAGGGTFKRTAGEADLAWLATAMLEYDNLRFGILIPDTYADTFNLPQHCGAAVHQPMPDGSFEVRRMEREA